VVLLRLNGGKLGWLAEYIAARQTTCFPIHGTIFLPKVVEGGATCANTGFLILTNARPYNSPSEVVEELLENKCTLQVGWVEKSRFEYATKSFIGEEAWLRSLFDRSPKIEFYKSKDVSEKTNMIPIAQKTEPLDKTIISNKNHVDNKGHHHRQLKPEDKVTTKDSQSAADRNNLNILRESLRNDIEIMSGQKDLTLFQAITLCDAFEDMNLMRDNDEISQEHVFQKGTGMIVEQDEALLFHVVHQLGDLDKIPIGELFKMTRKKLIEMEHEKERNDEALRCNEMNR
jgi:hypothetical protein